MPKSQNTCVLMELCKWGYVGQSKRRKPQLPYSLRICLLLLPLQVICLQIPHSTKGKKDTFFILGEKQDIISVTCVAGVPSCPESAHLGAAPSNCREARLRLSRRKCPSPGLTAAQVPFVRVVLGEMLCGGCHWGTFGLWWDVQHRILLTELQREYKPLGAEVDLSPEDCFCHSRMLFRAQKILFKMC